VELRDYREKSPESSLAPSLNPAGPPDPALHREGLSPDLLSGDPGPRNGGEGAAAGGEDAATPAGTFEDLLSRELRQHLNSGIVRHAQVVLRDKGEGLIRLSLKPESLGHVKIHLELTENKIAGRIIVESGEALRAFEREIASLEQAFRDSGYESAELNTFLAQDGQGSGGFQGEDRPFYSSRLAADKAASRYDEAVERTDTSFPGLPGDGFGPGNGHIQVNILV
jgi:flagellar hook-length control protein FliK